MGFVKSRFIKGEFETFLFQKGIPKNTNWRMYKCISLNFYLIVKLILSSLSISFHYAG